MFQPSDGGNGGDPLRPPCSYVQAPKDDELWRYALDGASLPYPMEEHIVTCNNCRQQLKNLMSVNSSLLRKLYRSRCPGIDMLARYSAGLASLNEGLLTLYHLQSCPLCDRELQEMRNILGEELF